MRNREKILAPILERFPDTQGVYLFGSYDTQYETPESDLDLAVLLPHETARSIDLRDWIQLAGAVGVAAEIEKVDLINLRTVDTVFRFIIIGDERRVYTGDERACLEFEALTLSLYQNLNEERRDIIAHGITGGFYGR